MRRTRCSHDGCANLARNGGVCRRHGAKRKRCSHEGCVNQVQRGGVCKRHGANSLATAQCKVERLPHPLEGCDATSVGAIARGGGEIGVYNPRTNISLAAVREANYHHPSATNLNLSDEEAISAWIYKSSRFCKTIGRDHGCH